jgi:hypothetical protein
VRKAGNETLSDGIASDEHDWNAWRRSLGRSRCSGSVGDEGIYLELDEFGGQLGIPGGVAVRVSLLDDEIAALSPAALFESLPKRIEGKGFRVWKQPPDPDFTNLLRLILLRAGRGAEWRQRDDGARDETATRYHRASSRAQERIVSRGSNIGRGSDSAAADARRPGAC